ncbi:hypothetical protein GWI33_010274 [Rhynchophorus ferrugineus]|uniref:Uncharacterized protein n=1 Tax=Rhynchophorus ferrugineus TaxID=354439 RepID=A0A834ME35_RHYFE|nr:hypothetical protein GWI33_010274 [Rhynchophorus ferrugineus]
MLFPSFAIRKNSDGIIRSNSSILGQKKKNQRKARNKKRAQERRYSESEASDVDSKKEGENQTNINPERLVKTVSSIQADEKKDDAIFHLEINN